MLCEYLGRANVQLNAEKTNLWVVGQPTTTLYVKGIPLQLAQRIKLLGHWFGARLDEHRLQAQNAATEIKAAAFKLACLPLCLEGRQQALAAITMSRILFCPWAMRWNWQLVSSLRTTLIHTTKPYLRKGPRAQAVVTNLLLRGQLDPVFAQLWRLLNWIVRAGAEHEALVYKFMSQLVR